MREDLGEPPVLSLQPSRTCGSFPTPGDARMEA